MKKKMVSWLLVCMMGLSLTACGSKTSKEVQSNGSEESNTQEGVSKESTTDENTENASVEKKEIYVFAAASMTETLTEIEALYEDENENIDLIFNFDSSGTLKTQIQEGAACDLFISAGQKQMNQLDSTADLEVNTEGLDYVLEDTRIDILENKVTLCVSDTREAGITTFDDWAAALKEGTILMAMGNSDVPVGQYTQKILAYYELSEEELANAGVISYGSNVKEVTTQVSEGSVDCGVIYCTDAYSAGLIVQDYATAEMCGQVIYPAAVLKISEHQEEAKAFLEYLQNDVCMEIFERVGFSRIG